MRRLGAERRVDRARRGGCLEWQVAGVVVSDTSPLSTMAKALDCIAELRRISQFRISDEVLARIAIDLGEIP